MIGDGGMGQCEFGYVIIEENLEQMLANLTSEDLFDIASQNNKKYLSNWTKNLCECYICLRRHNPNRRRRWRNESEFTAVRPESDRI